MKLKELLSVLPLYYGTAEADLEIEKIEQDSRKVAKGTLFICIDGEVVDGHQFAKTAEENGASVILAEHDVPVSIPVIQVGDTKRAMALLADQFYGSPSQKIRMVGVTGTNGKTTVTHLIDQIVRDQGEKTGLIGTMYMRIGDEQIETKNTTPDSLTLQKIFAEMNDKGITTAAMEVSSHALVQGRVYGTDYDVAVFTNLSQDHLDYHKTMEEYAHAKSLLFAQLGNKYQKNAPKIAVLNADDPASEIMSRASAAPVISYGIDQAADFMAKNITITSKGSSFELVSKSGTVRNVHIQMIGKFSIYNVLAALSTAYALGISEEDAIESLSQVKGVAGRFELVHAGQDFPVIVDYAHTPDGLLNVLETVDEFAKGRVFVVVGCGGDRDKGKRPKMARIAVDYATDPIFTSDNPRTEDPLLIIKDMEAGVPGEKYIVKPNRKEAIDYAIQQAESGDVILIAGKGHEDYQIIGTEKFDFDDRVMAREAIEKKLKL
ncbi:UDP-N-acetylmuramoylalanyl-D-glutamate--2,6-diaminopimelate ligase [Listeria floridensis FSL S10-1187]|uniref:UDP-N-acetylmuramoyl-L-alanyl-D-glutamate--2,6-diaminopimelate ligase n=1 Tax=Listeria floridensis FSL S10-1187 TaxID=1265817 RepID=A0ABN0RFH8_9LIST|nr:UDP-N-acetylmuramoyl-L-alanyl-D-glutamate--2,6-diaminopimelate ligase [Listeria floridensis]EUJ32074.1 UDP-N-acetylmuramoylalanyl-D-glutamate--2,6-diaminopimelate ligase [Listeria floridensis FSL S10-1187]